MKLHALLCLATLACGLSGSSGQDLESSSPTNLPELFQELTNAPAAIETNDAPEIRPQQAVVAIGRDAHLRSGNSAEAVVSIGGNARADGQVRDAVVAVFGDARASQNVGEAVVAVLGNAEAHGGVGDAVVAILGDARAEGEVRNAVVAVLGNVHIGSNAVVHGDAVSIGGTITLEDGAKVQGNIQEIGIAIPGMRQFHELPVWIRDCVLKMRLLSLTVAWPWIVAGVFLGLYALVAVVFPRPVEICLSQITNRPATTFLVGLLTKMLLPVLTIVLAATGVGVLALPFLFVGVFFAAIAGKVAMLQYLGGALTRAFGMSGMAKNLVALLIGSAITLTLYSIPILGFMAYAILGTWVLGAAVAGIFNYMSREKPHSPSNPIPPAGPGFTAQPPVNPPAAASFPSSPAVPSAFAYPRAGFWERTGAAFLDVALLAIPFVLIGPFAIPVAVAYFAGMWTWKGTTIGGIVLRHQIVRSNGEPMTFLVALVRCIASMFSAFVLFLGFFWIGWNREKQGWHDLIAGTCVVRLPHAMPLVCL